jgi:cell division GTPase FtsZ
MRLGLIGVGQAGGKIADAFVDYDRRNRSDLITSVTAVNTAKADLYGLEHVPEDRRLLVGGAQVKGHGVGADNELGARVADDELDEILSAVNDVPIGETDAFLVVAALGGGTGSGGAPVIARALKRIYTEPVYGLGILPSSDEGGVYTLNAARSFRTFVREVDNLIVFDNDAWRKSGESVGAGYREMNRDIVQRLGLLFGAGEVGPNGSVGESVVDASEIINTLSCGGVSTIGYASEEVDVVPTRSLLGRLTGGSQSTVDHSGSESRITSLVRRATLGRLTLPCGVQSASRALAVVSGPSPYLSRKGIERSRRWLEDETGSMEVRGGDYPVEGADHVSATVLLSNVSDVPRITTLQAVATETQDTMARSREEHDRNLNDLIADDDGALDPLF